MDANSEYNSNHLVKINFFNYYLYQKYILLDKYQSAKTSKTLI